MTEYNIMAETPEATVVAKYERPPRRDTGYQSEQDLENKLIKDLEAQGYEYISVKNSEGLAENLRRMLERLNNITFTDGEWRRLFDGCIANGTDGIKEKTRRIQRDHRIAFELDSGEKKNIALIDKDNIHNNTLQVINQFEENEGLHNCRYDVTVLVNGLPLVHIELKRRGAALKEAFNQIVRYNRDSFWAGSALYEYVQIYVISNGTHTKYYSNTTREGASDEAKRTPDRKMGNSFEFTSYWADGENTAIPDLDDFVRTFFARHTLLNILTKFCVFTADENLLVMRPYQIAATERILGRIKLAEGMKRFGSIEAGGYIWHTTGSGKTLTSFKTAQLATALPFIDKVLFVVDRKDLDYQTMREYERFQEGAANGNSSTSVLKRQLEDPGCKIIVTTIQKLSTFVKKNKTHEVYGKRVVMIFDECHRSQFGQMHADIVKRFKNYAIFGFTGTPIFTANAQSEAETTAQVFGKQLHTYTIINAINDGNVLPFRVDFLKTFEAKENIADEDVRSIDRKAAFLSPKRIEQIVEYILDNYNTQTKGKFNSILAADSIEAAKAYYLELKKQIAERKSELKIATIFTYTPNEDQPEELEPTAEGNDLLDKSSRDFLDEAIGDYNKMFNTNFDSGTAFGNYYKDLSQKTKDKQIDILIVVNMFLTGFDAKTLNTLWVDKNLRFHGLLQAFSRTNRILNSVKTFGNIVCFRNLRKEADDAIALFADKDAGGVIFMRPYDDYMNGYDEGGKHVEGYKELTEELTTKYTLDGSGEPLTLEEKTEFVKLMGKVLKLRNILCSFDRFEDTVPDRDFQDYRSKYLDYYNELRPRKNSEKADITDDLVFEIELIQQIEYNIEYILKLIEEYHENNCKDKEISAKIRSIIGCSPELRSKKNLIEEFLARVNPGMNDIREEWQKHVAQRREEDIKYIIESQHLKENETRELLSRALKDGFLNLLGTVVSDIMPPMSLFDKRRAEVRHTIEEKLREFFDRYVNL